MLNDVVLSTSPR